MSSLPLTVLAVFCLSSAAFAGICTDPGFAGNSVRSPAAVHNDFNNGDSVTFTCSSPGYYLYSGSLTISCQNDGSWSGDVPSCVLIDCGDPGEPLFGYRTITTTTYLSTVIFYCNPNYYEFEPPQDPLTTVSVTLTCGDSKQWSDTTPQCRRRSCGEPPAVAGTTVRTPGILYGDTAIYSANTGYRLTNSNVTVTCMEDRSWQPAGLIGTTAVKCLLPSLADNTQWSAETTAAASANTGIFEYAQNISAECASGYRETAGDAFRTCQDSETFSGSPLICEPITCGPLTIDGVIVDKTSNAIGSVATCSCNRGYVESGQGDTTRTCLLGGTWSGDDLVCLAIPCPAVNFTMPVNASVWVVSPGSGSVSGNITLEYQSNSTLVSVVNGGYGDKVCFECFNGTKWARGSNMWKCQSDGTWSSTTPILCKLTIPLPGINQVFRLELTEAENAEKVGRMIFVLFLLLVLAIAFVDAFSMARSGFYRLRYVMNDSNKKTN